MASSPTIKPQLERLQIADSPPPVDLHHPTPDLQSLQGAYVGNIERLEDHAERMSEKGSDLGEEIRKLHEEQKLSDSRRSSMRSAVVADEPTRPFSSRSRNASTSSYTNSIVDVNGAARWGGYSPGGYVTSPVGSLHSASFAHPSSLQRQRSGSRASRLGQVVHTEGENEETHIPTDHPGSPQSHKSVPRSVRRHSSPPAPSHRSVSSFTQKYDQIAQEIQNEMQENIRNSQHLEQGPFDGHSYPSDMPDRPPTAASTDTTHQARVLWQDFDGVHCPDTVPEEEYTPSQGSGSRKSSLIKAEPQRPVQEVPPPSDGMIFYPAPVPKMLNLPKRLSQLPAANVQARRRTQLLESMQSENRKSMNWAGEGESDPKQNRKSMDPRKSRQSLAGLPPQLRASAYFDQAPPAQEYEVKGESAEDTLESILAASAHAPVSAFTDHPFAGHVGNEVYGKEKHNRRASKAVDLKIAADADKTENRKSRSSLNLLDTRRNSSGDPLNKLKKRNSSADLNVLIVRAGESRMSLGDELDEPDHDARGPAIADETTPTRRSLDEYDERHSDDEKEGEDGEYSDEEEDEQHYFGPPTTLLAELQMRKQQQKSRNLTAATAFPNGMHSTLLQLDAVAEIEKKKRKGQKVNLAWEAAPPVNPEEDDSDDEVPLGMLYPGREGLAKRAGNAPQQNHDWDRPLGLIAQRELEDNEPLSRRRTRLVGFEPARRRTQLPDMNQGGQHLTVPTSTTPQPESEEDEGETLAQRVRRLKDQKALDNALGPDVRKSTVSGDFAAELMSEFGVPATEDAPKPSPSPGAEVEETLGQRRARLQREAQARGDANPLGSRPPLRSSMSMADILSAHPIDNTHAARGVSDEQLLSSLPQGSLLHKNAVRQSRLEAERIDRNRRTSSYGALDGPLLQGVGKEAPEQAVAANIKAYKERYAGPGTPQTAPMPAMQSTMYGSNGGLNPAMSNMNLPGQRESFFPGMMPQMGMNGIPGMNGMGAMGYPGGNMMMQHQQQQQMMAMNMSMMGMQMNSMPGMPLGYGAQMGGMNGMRQPSMYGMPMGGGMQLQQQMAMEPMMDPRQRETIDRWRSGVS